MCRNHSHVVTELAGVRAELGEPVLMLRLKTECTVELPTGVKLTLPHSTNLYVSLVDWAGLPLSVSPATVVLSEQQSSTTESEQTTTSIEPTTSTTASPN